MVAAIGWKAEALRPPTPAHLTARPRDDGGFDIGWTRRSRAGWAWTDFDAPLAETEERYRATIRRADGTERTIELGVAALLYAAVDVAADRLVGDHIDVIIEQLGTNGISRPATSRIDF